MDLNISLILLVILVVIVLLFLFLKKNAKDKRSLSKTLNSEDSISESDDKDVNDLNR